MAESNLQNHLAIGELPILAVVPLEQLVFHEEPDEERLITLVNRLGTEGILKNPPIVARFGNNGKYVILDGANRVTALNKLGFKNLVVQLVDFDDPLLGLYCWNHAVEKLDLAYFSRRIKRMSNVEIVPGPDQSIVESGVPESQGNHYICHLTSPAGRTISVTSESDLIDQVCQLIEITSLYLSTPMYDRVSYNNLHHLKHNYPDFCTLLTFRHFSKNDFLKIVGNDLRLPAGVTRVFLPKRALGLNIPLEFLKSGLTLEEQNHWLDEMIFRKVREKSIRFYREPTFIFDE
jgi:hypothetical protein